MKKNARYWVRPASVFGIWLLGAVSGHCFCTPVGPRDELTVSGAASSTAGSPRQCDPLGEASRAEGPVAKTAPSPVSTKCHSDGTEPLYYGYRYYSASTGRWLSRDPIEELGGNNLYQFVQGDPLSKLDPLGKDFWPCTSGEWMKCFDRCQKKKGPLYYCSFCYAYYHYSPLPFNCTLRVLWCLCTKAAPRDTGEVIQN